MSLLLFHFISFFFAPKTWICFFHLTSPPPRIPISFVLIFILFFCLIFFLHFFDACVQDVTYTQCVQGTCNTYLVRMLRILIAVAFAIAIAIRQLAILMVAAAHCWRLIILCVIRKCLAMCNAVHVACVHAIPILHVPVSFSRGSNTPIRKRFTICGS